MSHSSYVLSIRSLDYIEYRCAYLDKVVDCNVGIFRPYCILFGGEDEDGDMIQHCRLRLG